MQANAWPMAPSLGLEYHIPGPATLDGHVPGPWDPDKSNKSCQHIVDMLNHMKRHPTQGGPEVMEMPKFWHPKMNWYGPAGIGTGRGISGFRNWHQIPPSEGAPKKRQLEAPLFPTLATTKIPLEAAISAALVTTVVLPSRSA